MRCSGQRVKPTRKKTDFTGPDDRLVAYLVQQQDSNAFDIPQSLAERGWRLPQVGQLRCCVAHDTCSCRALEIGAGRTAASISAGLWDSHCAQRREAL